MNSHLAGIALAACVSLTAAIGAAPALAELPKSTEKMLRDLKLTGDKLVADLDAEAQSSIAMWRKDIPRGTMLHGIPRGSDTLKYKAVKGKGLRHNKRRRVIEVIFADKRGDIFWLPPYLHELAGFTYDDDKRGVIYTTDPGTNYHVILGKIAEAVGRVMYDDPDAFVAGVAI